MKTYFLSDTHFGAGSDEEHRLFLLSSFVDSVCEDGSALYLLGDIFDFWVEYHGRPRTIYAQALSQIQRVVDAGIPVTLIRGNHEFMPTHYLQNECGVMVESGPFELIYGDKKVLLLHGHELSTKRLFRVAHWILSNSFFQFLYLRIPSRIGSAFADFMSAQSRKKSSESTRCSDKSIEKYYANANELLKSKNAQILVMGHTHRAESRKLQSGIYANGGSWLDGNEYITIDSDGDVELCTLKS